MEAIGDVSRAGLFVGGLIVCLLLEKLFPLRESVQPRTQRIIRNLAFAGINTLIMRMTFLGVLSAVALWSGQHRFGLLPMLSLPASVEVIAGLLLMDYTFYFWHVGTHRIPFLWRFHNVHHTDLDLDVSTAARFHAGELALSAPFRVAQILLIGVTPFTWVLFEVLVVASTQFHHANIRLPEPIDRFLNKVIVTPRMHGIHHSMVRGETDSNYSTIFSFWDRLHRSFNHDLPPFPVGVPAYRDPDELTLWRLFAIPFQKPRPWRLPDGQVPNRSVDS